MLESTIQSTFGFLVSLKAPYNQGLVLIFDVFVSANMCVHVMYAFYLNWRPPDGARLLLKEQIRQHPPSPYLQSWGLMFGVRCFLQFFILRGSLARVHTTSTLNIGGRARVLLNLFRQPTKSLPCAVFLHTAAAIVGFRFSVVSHTVHSFALRT